jgi:hypothetical protein
LAAGSTGLSAAAVMGVGAVSGAVGSMVSQGVGLATGQQEKFSWKGVALSALSGAASAGMGPGGIFGKLGAFANVGSKFAQGALRGAIGSAVTQGVGVATKLQSNFDFAGVAAAGVGGGVAAWTGGRLIPAMKNGLDPFAAQMFSSGASAIANAAMRSLVRGSDFGDNLIAALPDVIGATLGNLIVDGVSYNRGSQRVGERKSESANKAGGTIGEYSGMGGPDESFTVSGNGHEFQFSEDGTGTTLSVILAGRNDPELLLDLANRLTEHEIPIESTIADLASEIDRFSPEERVEIVQDAYNILNSDATNELAWSGGNQRLDELTNEFNLGIAETFLTSGLVFRTSDVRNPINHAVYSIIEGDTLSAIALTGGLSLEDLATANALTNFDSIRAGDSLLIPTQRFMADEARRAYIFNAYLSGQQNINPSGRSFTSFTALKRYLGSPGSGNQWHHIVEQTPQNIRSFGDSVIQSTDNIIAVSASDHVGKGSISAYYSQKDTFTGTQTVRQWLSTQSFPAQREFGLQVLRKFGY